MIEKACSYLLSETLEKNEKDDVFIIAISGNINQKSHGSHGKEYKIILDGESYSKSLSWLRSLVVHLRMQQYAS